MIAVDPLQEHANRPTVPHPSSERSPQPFRTSQPVRDYRGEHRANSNEQPRELLDTVTEL